MRTPAPSFLRLVFDPTPDGRVAPRHKSHGLRCYTVPNGPLGWFAHRTEVIDFSVRGIRIARRLPWPKHAKGRVILAGAQEVGVVVWASCVWARREGLTRHVCGLAFDEVAPDVAKRIELLVEWHGVAPTLSKVA